MYPREALNTLLKKGAVKNEDFNVNVEMQEAKTKVEDKLCTLEEKAEKHKILSYARLNSITEIKTWLFTNKTPVPIAIATDNLTLDSNNVIQVPKIYPKSGHAMLIIGYNEVGFIVQNSWGTDWGNNGIATLPYDYEIKEAWAVTLENYAGISDIKKPSMMIVRKILMVIINWFKSFKK